MINYDYIVLASYAETIRCELKIRTCQIDNKIPVPTDFNSIKLNFNIARVTKVNIQYYFFLGCLVQFPEHKPRSFSDSTPNKLVPIVQFLIHYILAPNTIIIHH